MRAFFKLANNFNSYKFAGTALFGSFLAFNQYSKAYTGNSPPKEDYNKQLGAALHTKLADAHFL